MLFTHSPARQLLAPTLAEAARRLKPQQYARMLPRLLLMTDSRRLPDPEAAIRRLPPGSGVIARDADAARLARLARRIAPLCRARGVRLLVSGDWRLARAIGAGGLHLPEAMVRQGERRWRAARRPGWLVTAAAHSPTAIRRAALQGIDAVLLAPVFATASHPQARPIGPLRFARWTAASPIPVYALGGIDGPAARRLRESGAAGFAAIGALAPPLQAEPSSSR